MQLANLNPSTLRNSPSLGSDLMTFTAASKRSSVELVLGPRSGVAILLEGVNIIIVITSHVFFGGGACKLRLALFNEVLSAVSSSFLVVWYTRGPVLLTRSTMKLQLKYIGLLALLCFCSDAVSGSSSSNSAGDDDDSESSDGLFQYTNGPVPDVFQVDQSYPDRTEIEECRPIRLRIQRNSRRYHSDLVVNTNSDIDFANSDARRMTSRMQSRLDALAVLFYQEFSVSITVMKTWTEYGDEDVDDDQSLHFEGRRVCRVCMHSCNGGGWWLGNGLITEHTHTAKSCSLLSLSPANSTI